MWQNSLTPQGGMDAKSLDAQNGVGPPPPPTVVWTFGQKKFVSRISINKLIACLERVQWRYQNRERRGRGGQLLFYVLKQVECRQKLLREPQYKFFFLQNLLWTRSFDPPPNVHVVYRCCLIFTLFSRALDIIFTIFTGLKWDTPIVRS